METSGRNPRRQTMKTLFLLFLGAGAAFCQPFSFGVRGGVPLTDFIDAAKSTNANGFLNYATHTNRYIIGVTGELRLPFGLGIELDALYRHLNYQSSQQLVGVTTTTTIANTTSNAFEFPLLAKYRFGPKILKPFVDAGVAWDTLQGLKQDVKTTILNVTGSSTSSSTTPSQLQHKTTRGYVAGFGVDIKLLLIHIQPEIRYTRWGAQHFLDPNALLHSNQNLGEFLLGIEF